jgi:homocitrate synthase
MIQPETSRPFRIVDCTLREGEQFALAAFTTEQRIAIATKLDAFGVDVIEMTTPVASPRAEADLRRVVDLGLQAEIAAHIRCSRMDAEVALACGVDALHLVMGTSPQLRLHSHGRDLLGILEVAREVLPHIVGRGASIRFSCEDAFRTPMRDVLRIAQVVEDLGVSRIGIADTVGCATPDEVAQRVSVLRAAVNCDIEFHGHNDGDCAVANAWAAWRAGATHIDVTVLGIGERNGIASLGGLIARAAQSAPHSVQRYRIDQLLSLDQQVARALGIEVPFNACITSPTAFSHKAGMHTKAVLAEPTCYEALNPADFGRTREILVGHTLVGRHAISERARLLGLSLDDASILSATRALKNLTDSGAISSDSVDDFLKERAARSTPSTLNS